MYKPTEFIILQLFNVHHDILKVYMSIGILFFHFRGWPGELIAKTEDFEQPKFSEVSFWVIEEDLSCRLSKFPDIPCSRLS